MFAYKFLCVGDRVKMFEPGDQTTMSWDSLDNFFTDRWILCLDSEMEMPLAEAVATGAVVEPFTVQFLADLVG